MRITTVLFAALLALLSLTPAPVRAETPSKPNVVIILTDDQGFGELGATGNPLIHTPHIDRLATQSVSLVNFHVMPVCSPTRACLMTGRYNYRTGVTDTFLGRSLMDPRETTLAEMLAAGGYRTGIFGKWHLGDNYPMRAMDRGFQESLVLNGGGLAQPGDPPDPVDERGAYFNATLRHNGAWVKTKGYVSDVITDAAMQFIEQKRDRPFFVYLPFNCPHAPHQVPDEYRRHYEGKDFSPAGFPHQGHPMAAKRDPDDLARIYGMIENIDDNVGRLLAKLAQLKLADNTIVVLFSDNGCQQCNGYNAGFQGWKGTPFEGGIHQFCFVRWPAQLQAGHKVDRIAAHIDLAPTLLDLCGVPRPQQVKFDGRSLSPLLRGQPVAWPDRVLCFQWHRGDAPQRYRAFAARSQDWKLVQPLGVVEKWNGKTNFQLYDMAHDPLELHDLAAAQPQRVAQLKAQYDAWFDDVTTGRDYGVPPRIFLGAPQENPVLLTRQDWRGQAASWGAKGIGYWEVNVVGQAKYDVKLQFERRKSDEQATFSCGGVSLRQSVKTGDDECIFRNVPLPFGPGRLEASVGKGPAEVGVRYVEVKRIDGDARVQFGGRILGEW
jgi:arylsulfatase A-like enzyme